MPVNGLGVDSMKSALQFLAPSLFLRNDRIEGAKLARPSLSNFPLDDSND